MSSKVVKIETTGEIRVTVSLKPAETVNYTTIVKTVGGFFERIPMKSYTMWVNANSDNSTLPNELATNLYNTVNITHPHRVITGDVLITGNVSNDGDTLGLTNKGSKQLYEQIRALGFYTRAI